MGKYKVDLEKARKIPELLGIKNFGGRYKLGNYELVAGMDGTGSKIEVARRLKKYDTIGIDLVAMNVNDILCEGARPLFFLDYIGTKKLDLEIFKELIRGVKKGCDIANCKLIGGETAEMKYTYMKNRSELVGCVVGVEEKKIKTEKVTLEDKIWGLPSSGVHSNGYTLILDYIKELTLEYLTPTKIYTEILEMIEPYEIKAIAHITGGGIVENTERVLNNYKMKLNKKAWEIPQIFKDIQKVGNISEKEMFEVFNMGIGMTLVSNKELPNAFLIGEVSE